MIPLKEYANRLGKNPVTAAQRAARGAFTTAKKIGCQWFIEEGEPWVDGRVRSGDYVGFREKLKKKPTVKK